ncbi:MAG: RNA polymerase sigma factor [Acidobacteria bacterium]|nr:RNA polymerase sigma factor [Acidobacteriota bacterium]
MDWDAEREQHWLEELRRGDEAAFRLIYHAYRSRLYTFLCRLSGRPDVAEDLLQEVWLRLAARPPQPRSGLTLAPWLFRVARNLFVSYLRNRGRDPVRTFEVGLLEFRPAPGPGPLEVLAEQEATRRLERALQRLPLADRETVLLVAGGGLTPAEAAGALGIRPDAFRQRLARARARLAELLRSTA